MNSSLSIREFFQSRVFIGVVVGVVVFAVGYGIFVSGSPAKQRTLQFDQRRVSDLQQISVAVDDYWAREGKLPERLEDLRDGRYAYVRSITDPATEEPYEYGILSDTTYELCAVFERDSTEQQEQYRKPFSEQIWDHGVGRTCFNLEVRKPIAPLREQIPIPVR